MVDHKIFSCTNACPSYLKLCIMLPAPKPSYVPKSSPSHHHASRSNGYVEVQRTLHLQFLFPLSKPHACENMFTTHKWFLLLHLCIQSNRFQSMPHNDVKTTIYMCSYRSVFILFFIADAAPSRPSIMGVTQCLFFRYARSFG